MTQKDLLTVFHKTNGHCFYCASKDAREIDHFFPTALHVEWGNEGYVDNNALENLFLSCVKCNRQKNAMHPDKFLGNEFTCWSRYLRSNYRVGLSNTRVYSEIYG